MKKYIFILASIAVAAFLIVSVISYVSIRKLMFNSDPTIGGTKVSAIAKDIRSSIQEKYDTEEISIDSVENIKLSGLLIKRNNAKGSVILCHGFQRSKEFTYPFIDMFDNYNILMFDFRGQGQSEGNLITMGIKESYDVLAAADFMKKRFPDEPLVITGVSMGAAALLKAAHLDSELCDAIIVDSAFKSLSSVIAYSFTFHSGLPRFPFLNMMLLIAKRIYHYDADNFKPKRFIADIKIPIFFIHSSFDKIVPTSHTLSMYAKSYNAGNNPELWITPPVFHGTGAKSLPEEYKARVQKFMKKVLQV